MNIEDAAGAFLIPVLPAGTRNAITPGRGIAGDAGIDLVATKQPFLGQFLHSGRPPHLAEPSRSVVCRDVGAA